MAKDNPILPSEPLSLERNLIAAAVIAEELDNHKNAEANGQDHAPRNSSKVKRRLDNRHYGRSESCGRSEEEEDCGHSAGRRYRDRSRYSDVSPRNHTGHAHHERSHSPRRAVPDDRGRAMAAGRGHADEDRDSKRYRIGGSAAEDGGQAPLSYYAHGSSGMAASSVLGIFGMSKFTTEARLRDLFGGYGPVTSVQIITDQVGHSRGYGFINMANAGDAQRARDSLNDTYLHDRRVRVDFSFTNRPHSPTPGKYRGQDTNGHHRGYANGRSSAYRPRRRANSRDRRRDHQDRERHYEPPPSSRGGDRWGRSRSPARHHRELSPTAGGGYQPPPLLATRSSYGSYRSSNYADHARGGREHHDAYGPSRSRSPPHRRPPAHGHHADYQHHGRSGSRGRHLRNDDHRHEIYDRPPPPPPY
ncbi:Transformer-2 protein alpha [Coemansia sp. BCRC 34301]|nr:Transformer-2 protein alpha [Coemansia sp. BCRC 34301]